MMVSYLIGEILTNLLLLYALLMMLFNKRANAIFLRILNAGVSFVGMLLKIACTIVLRIVRSILNDLVTVIDAVLGRIKPK